jgi:hypothetical protein
MQSLHQESTNAANQRAEIGVHHPGCIAWQIETWFITRRNDLEPGRNAIGIARE